MSAEKINLWERVLQLMAVTQSTSSAVKRECPECGDGCHLSQGRNSKRWFWTHEHWTECRLDKTGTRIHFQTKDEAISADQIFRAI